MIYIKIYLALSLFFGIACAIDFNYKDVSSFSFRWTIYAFFFSFVSWPYGVYKAIVKWKGKA